MVNLNGLHKRLDRFFVADRPTFTVIYCDDYETAAEAEAAVREAEATGATVIKVQYADIQEGLQ